MFPFLKDEEFFPPLRVMRDSDLKDQKTVGHHLSRWESRKDDGQLKFLIVTHVSTGMHRDQGGN